MVGIVIWAYCSCSGSKLGYCVQVVSMRKLAGVQCGALVRLISCTVKCSIYILFSKSLSHSIV